MLYGITEPIITAKGYGKSLEVAFHLLGKHCVMQEGGLRPEFIFF